MGESSTWFIIKNTLFDWYQRLLWNIMPGTEISVETKEGTIVVEYGHPRWYDVGASRVEVYSDDPHDHYGPWLKEHVGREFIDWQMRRHMVANWNKEYDDIQVDDYVLIKIRDPNWATIARLMFK